MANVLHIDSSARGEGSISRRLSAEFLRTWLASHPDDTVTYRDLGATPLPFVTDEWVAATFTPHTMRTEAQRQVLAGSDVLVDELLAADVLVLGVPMYNFSVPAAFKAWIDLVARAGRTFQFTPQGPKGLAVGKKAFVLVSSASDYSQAPLSGMDFHEPYVRTILGFLGITDVQFVRHGGMGPALVEASLNTAHARIAQLAAN